VALLALFCAAGATQTPPAGIDAREIIRRALEGDEKNARQALLYTFVQRREERKLDKQDQVKSASSETFDITLLDGSEYRRLIARNGQPLSPEEERKQQRELDKSIEKIQNETPREREKRLAERAKRKAEQREFVKEIPAVYDFTVLGEDTAGGVKTWIIGANPRASYEPKHKRAKFLKKLRGKLWISQSDYGVVKMEAETIDTVSFGLFLVRLNRGATLEFEQTKVNDEVWLLEMFRVRFQGRAALVKGFHREVEAAYGKYHKFHTESRIAILDEAE
jgi:hypothetical protein